MLLCCRTTCYFYCTSLPILSVMKKNVSPASLLSNALYNFSCLCGSQYVGTHISTITGENSSTRSKIYKTGQIPNSRNISTCSGKTSTPVMFSESVIGHTFYSPAHLLLTGTHFRLPYVRQKLQ